MRALGIALLALAVMVPRRRLWPALSVALAATAGLLIARACWSASFENRRGNWWAIGVAMLLAVGVWWAAPRQRTASSMPASRWGLFAGCTLAVYSCVPETDQMPAVALLIAFVAVAEGLGRGLLPAPVDAAMAGVIMWSALFGATGRPSALIGGLFALVPLVAVPAVLAARPALAAARLPWRWGLAIVWVGAAGAVARTGGIADSAAPAWVAVACCTALAVAASELLARLAR